MKTSKLEIKIANRFVLATLGVTLAIGIAACKTTTNQTATSSDARKSAGRFYTCAMHPTVRSLDPDGKCPFCSMSLIPAETVEVVNPATGETNTAATVPAISGYYSCPMHPTVLSQDPNGKCPSCGMPLVPVESPVFIQNK